MKLHFFSFCEKGNEANGRKVWRGEIGDRQWRWKTTRTTRVRGKIDKPEKDKCRVYAENKTKYSKQKKNITMY